jgi:hypothetical protein
MPKKFKSLNKKERKKSKLTPPKMALRKYTGSVFMVRMLHDRNRAGSIIHCIAAHTTQDGSATIQKNNSMSTEELNNVCCYR